MKRFKKNQRTISTSFRLTVWIETSWMNWNFILTNISVDGMVDRMKWHKSVQCHTRIMKSNKYTNLPWQLSNLHVSFWLAMLWVAIQGSSKGYVTCIKTVWVLNLILKWQEEMLVQYRMKFRWRANLLRHPWETLSKF